MFLPLRVLPGLFVNVFRGGFDTGDADAEARVAVRLACGGGLCSDELDSVSTGPRFDRLVPMRTRRQG
ncbi:MAG: hypothetical protein ACR2OZ_11840 [Verrucomicrobiales bacterium]